jgi:hypothetical protein
MRLMEFINSVSETVGAAGLAYEARILKAMSAAQIPGLEFKGDTSAGYSSHGAGDIEASYNGNAFNIEVKAKITDQMGGGSLKYDRSSGIWTPSEKLAAASEPEDIELMISVAKSAQSAVDAYLDALAKLEPIDYHSKMKGIPFIAQYDSVTETGARETLKASGHHKAINRIVQLDERYIVGLYNKKGVYYIQIGGAGLFYLGKDPLGLGVPPFKGEVNIEMRLGFAGGAVKIPGHPELEGRRAELRCIGRMKTKSTSPFSLDDPNSIKSLFNK